LAVGIFVMRSTTSGRGGKGRGLLVETEFSFRSEGVPLTNGVCVCRLGVEIGVG
jgi:hypothetical protein